MHRIVSTIIFLALLALSTGCQPSLESVIVTPSEAPVPGPTPNVPEIAQSYPRVDGSTSAYPLQVLAACKILAVECAWTESPFIDLTAERRIGPDLLTSLTPAGEIVTGIFHSGTHQAYVNLINNETDFILVARLPSPDEIREAGIKGIRLDVRPVALDAFVFLAHVDNPIGSLTIEQIRNIYTGKITTWDELGGAGQIDAYQRDRNSGSQELMDDLVMKGARMVDAPDMIFPGMMGPINAIHDDTLGIGYSVYFYVTFMLPDENIKLLGIEGVVPTSGTIASRAYPLVTEVYAVMRANTPAESTAVMLRDWLLTDEGQDAVEDSGYVPVR